MNAPIDCPRPAFGHLVAWCRSGFSGGAWLIVDHAGKVVTQYGEPFSAARHVNQSDDEVKGTE